MDHQLMSLAKAIVAHQVKIGMVSGIDFNDILFYNLPKRYSGRHIEARHWLQKEGFIRHNKESDRVEVTNEAIRYIKEEGELYFQQARSMLERDNVNPSIANKKTELSEELWDNPQKNRKIIEENINTKRSDGKNRSIKVKVSMSDEEVHLIDWLGKRGYGHEGSRSATLRQAICDISKLADELEINDMSNFISTVLGTRLPKKTDQERLPRKSCRSKPKHKIFIIRKESEIKDVLQEAIHLEYESSIFCVKGKESIKPEAMDLIIKGVSMAYKGQILKVEQEFISYNIKPSK